MCVWDVWVCDRETVCVFGMYENVIERLFVCLGCMSW